MLVRRLFIVSFIFLFPVLKAQTTERDTILPAKKAKVMALPVMFYLPETRWGGGLAGIFRFSKRNDPDTLRSSNIIFTLTYTQLRQIVFSAPYQMWFKREKYNVYGEFGYQRENYLFFGVGNDAPPNYQERYSLKVARLQVTALSRIYPHLYAGVRFAIDHTALFQFADTGQLVKGLLPGSSGGYTSGAGITLKYDSRNNQFYASKGHYLEITAAAYSKFMNSDYTFNEYTVNASTYKKISARQVLAINGYLQLMEKNVPFYHMAMLGGDARMRGIYNGRYRDKDCWILQAEYRVLLFWRFGATVFASAGSVASQVNKFDLGYTRFAYGAGLRGMVDKKQHLNLRFDAGVSNKDVNFYFTFSEAF